MQQDSLCSHAIDFAGTTEERLTIGRLEKNDRRGDAGDEGGGLSNEVHML